MVIIFLIKSSLLKKRIIPEIKQILAPFYAARFAAKEAVAKAFRTGIGKEFGWLDSEIVRGEEGEPFIKLSEAGMKRLKEMGGSKILVSLTHLSTVASAVVIIISE